MARLRAFIGRYPVLTFVVLTLGFQFTVVGFLAWRQGQGQHMHEDALSHMVFRFRVFGPLGFAVLLSWWLEGRAGLRTLFGSYCKWKAPARFYAMALSWKFVYFYAGIVVLTVLGIGEWHGWVVPGFFDGDHAQLMNLLRNMGFIVGIAFVEETAWMKYSVTRLQAKYSALASCSIVGVCWGFWYLPMLLVGEGVPDGFIAPVFMASMFALTILLGWMFNMTRSGPILMLAQIVSNCAFFIVPAFVGHGGVDPTNINAFVAMNCVGSLLLVLVYGWRELGTGKRATWGEERGPVEAPAIQPLASTRGTLK